MKKSYDIGFWNPEDKRRDEAEFDTESEREAVDCFFDFCKENHFNLEEVKILYVDEHDLDCDFSFEL